LKNETQSWAQNRALFNAIKQTIPVIDQENFKESSEQISKHAIPELFQNALSVNFDESLGHGYFQNAEERFDFFKEKRDKIPFHVEILNRITKGGIEKGTLNCIIGETNKGKSIIGTSVAAHCLSEGYNGVYFTMEMDEEWISRRVDADLMDITLDEFEDLPKQFYIDKLNTIKQKTSGELYTKQYPTSGAHAGHFRYFIKDLKLKKGFKPDFIIVDYLTICASARLKYGSGVNTNTLYKAISEELRGLAIEFDVPVLTFVQYNREGMGSNEVDITDTAESIGITHTFDLYLAMISTEELEDRQQVLMKQLKNRYGPADQQRRFIMGMDKPRMRIHDVVVQDQINEDEEYTEPPQPKQANPEQSVPKNKPNTSGLKI